jgi:hypothetical protein
MGRLTTLLVSVGMMAITTFVGTSYAGLPWLNSKDGSNAGAQNKTVETTPETVDNEIEFYRKAILLHPDNPKPHNALCRMLFIKRDYDGAIAECHEALPLDPQ